METFIDTVTPTESPLKTILLHYLKFKATKLI